MLPVLTFQDIFEIHKDSIFLKKKGVKPVNMRRNTASQKGN